MVELVVAVEMLLMVVIVMLVVVKISTAPSLSLSSHF